VIIDTLATLPYKVIWKWKNEDLPGNLDNVLVEEWLPQQDILGSTVRNVLIFSEKFVAHPSVKVFLTQGGLQSLEESISREVPLVAMPFMFDQPLNAQRIVDLEIGLTVDPLTA